MSTAAPRTSSRAHSATADDKTSGRERILYEAAELFLSNGYGDTSLRDIAAAVGIQPASIYHHFGSKEELFTEILRIGIGHTTDAFDHAARHLQADADPRDIMGQHIEAHIEALFENRPYTAANIVVFPVAPQAVKTAVIPIRDAYEQRWDAVFQKLAASGDLESALDVQMARRIVLASINSTIEWFNPPAQTKKQRQSVSDLAQTMTDLVWKGIGQ